MRNVEPNPELGNFTSALLGNFQSALTHAGGQVPAPPAAAPPAPAHGGRGDRAEPFEPDELDGARHRPARAGGRGADGARPAKPGPGDGRDAGQDRREGTREDAPGVLLADLRGARRDRVPVRADARAPPRGGVPRRLRGRPVERRLRGVREVRWRSARACSTRSAGRTPGAASSRRATASRRRPARRWR